MVSLQGDGGFLFGQSDALWTMSRYDVPVITVIANNHSYDEPRNQMQARGGRAAQENRDMICYLGSPDVDFTHIGLAHGIGGERVLNPDQLEPAIRRGDSNRSGRETLHTRRRGCPNRSAGRFDLVSRVFGSRSPRLERLVHQFEI